MRILTVSPPSRIVWIYAWTASRTSCERFPCDVLPFRNSSISSRFSFSRRRVIRSFSSIRFPRLNHGKGYDEVIHHSAQFSACCPPYPEARYIYLLSIVIRRRTKGLHRRSESCLESPFDFYFVCQMEDASWRRRTGRSALRIRREKLYENRSYVRLWRGRRADPALDGKGPRPAAPRAVVALDRGRRPVDHQRGGGRRGPTLAHARRESFAAAGDRSTCGRSKPSGNPRGSANTYTSRARTPLGRSGTPRSPTRTCVGESTWGAAPRSSGRSSSLGSGGCWATT